MIEPNAKLSINRKCALLGVARSSFSHRQRAESTVGLDLLARFDRIFTDHPVYGSRPLQVALRREGIAVGRRRIRRSMKKLGLCAVLLMPNTSKPNQEHKIYPYLLRNKVIDHPNQVWSTDNAYIPMRQGFLYLVVILDWSTPQPPAWGLFNALTVGFRSEAPRDALAWFGTPEIFNSDQGSQFTSEDFTKVLRERGVQINMDERGRCHDNIFVELLWWTVKHEWVYLGPAATGIDQKRSLSEFFDWYNWRRSHQALGEVGKDSVPQTGQKANGGWLTPDEAYYGSITAATAKAV